MTVTSANIATELGRTPPAAESIQDEQWTMWIARAYKQISERLGDLSLLDQETLDDVVTMAVAQHVRRPDDATQVTTSADDGSVSRTYSSGNGQVTILDEWWERLKPGYVRTSITVHMNLGYDGSAA